MFLAANFIDALVIIFGYLLKLYTWAFIIRALLSWVSPDPFNPIVQFLQRVTDPILYPIQRLLDNCRMGAYQIGVDLSPMVAILIIMAMESFIIRSLVDLANRLRYGWG